MQELLSNLFWIVKI